LAVQGAEAVAVAVAASVSAPAEPAQSSDGASLQGSDVIGGSSSDYFIGAEQRRRDRRPKRFAVFALMASSNFLGCSFGGGGVPSSVEIPDAASGSHYSIT